MSNKVNAMKRIQKDLEKVHKEDDPGFVVNPDENNLFSVSALMAGP
jgi:ubiquitin-protein ligase